MRASNARVRGYACIAFSILFQLLSVYFGKKAALGIHWTNIWAAFSNLYFLASLACLALQALVWPFALREFPLVVAYTIMTLVYPGLLLISYFAFQERIGLMNMVGAALIMAGVAMFSMDSGGRGS